MRGPMTRQEARGSPEQTSCGAVVHLLRCRAGEVGNEHRRADFARMGYNVPVEVGRARTAGRPSRGRPHKEPLRASDSVT
jgi:hypothetical protein